MRPIQKTISIAAATSNSVATSQTPVNNVALTLNGSLVTSGVATFTYPTQVSFTSTSNLSTVTFTVYGLVLNADGTKTANSEAVTGPNNTTTPTTLTFVNVNLITVATATTFSSQKIVVGGAAVGLGNGDWWPLDIYNPNQVTTISCNILGNGSATYSVEYTNEDIWDTAVYPTALAVVHPVAALTGASTDQTAFTTTLMRAVRVAVASGAGQLRVTVVQQSTA